VRVRIGVHTGSPQRHADGYVGMDVHRAARVAACAHGGQVVLSEATAHLAEDALPAGVDLLDLGEHQLKDIPTRTRVLQVRGPGLASTFPPLRSLGSAASLPTSLVEVVGRDAELVELHTLVTQGARLVTLTGPGGTGKTTLGYALAASVADAFPDGVFVAPMAGVSSAAGMWASLSGVLDVPADGQIPPGFFTYVAHRRVFLVLDNLEQIADADVAVRELLAHARHVAVVATSRRALHVAGEHEFAVTPLPVEAAVELFTQHAKRVRRGFALTPDNRGDIAAVCTALDGLPLAVELAAARCKLLSPKAILARIDQSLDLASTDRSRDTRQATIRGAIGWSYDLLDSPHRAVLDCLGVFVGGASFEAIEAVVPAVDLAGADLADVLFDLVDASLVTVVDSEDGEPRFGLLETVRRFALDQLESSGRREAAESAHAQYFYDLASEPIAHFQDVARVRLVILGDLANLDAVLNRGAPGVRHPGAYEGLVPAAHVAALLTLGAGIAAQLAAVDAWAHRGLEVAGVDDDEGRAALMRQLGTLAYHNGHNEESVRVCSEVWGQLEPVLARPVSSTLPSWVRADNVAAGRGLQSGVGVLGTREVRTGRAVVGAPARVGGSADGDLRHLLL